MDIFFIKKDSFLEKNQELIKPFINPDFKSEKRRAEFALSRYLLNYAAQHFDIENPKIEIKNNKPYFLNSDIHFSISHSKNIVAIAFDKTPIGLDVEYIKKRNIDKIGNYFNKTFSDIKEFYKFWTQYEAEIKLQKKVEFSLTFVFLSDYMVSVTGVSKVTPANIFELENNLCLKKSAQYF